MSSDYDYYASVNDPTAEADRLTWIILGSTAGAGAVLGIVFAIIYFIQKRNEKFRTFLLGLPFIGYGVRHCCMPKRVDSMDRLAGVKKEIQQAAIISAPSSSFISSDSSTYLSGDSHTSLSEASSSFVSSVTSSSSETSKAATSPVETNVGKKSDEVPVKKPGPDPGPSPGPSPAPAPPGNAPVKGQTTVPKPPKQKTIARSGYRWKKKWRLKHAHSKVKRKEKHKVRKARKLATQQKALRKAQEMAARQDGHSSSQISMDEDSDEDEDDDDDDDDD